jgi:hypothetical protein
MRKLCETRSGGSLRWLACRGSASRSDQERSYQNSSSSINNRASCGLTSEPKAPISLKPRSSATICFRTSSKQQGLAIRLERVGSARAGLAIRKLGRFVVSVDIAGRSDFIVMVNN